MSAYLIVDVDDLIEYLDAQNFAPNLLDVAMSLRNTAALAAGLPSSDDLAAIAATNWNKYRRVDSSGVNVQQVFVSCKYDLFNVTERKFLTDALLTDYFPIDAEAKIDELILVSSKPDFVKILDRLHLKTSARVRIWADMQSSIREEVVFQPLESILGVKAKSIALYVDFENISISLNEQGYIVDLDILITALKQHAALYGQLVHIAAYAPWGQRGSLPPMLDAHGREISDDVPSRLALESIDPVFSLPGKNSADLRIAKDVLAESSNPNSPEIIIIASGDRDFNDIYNTLRARGKQVIVWGVRGSTSRVLENNPSIKLEYVDDFALFRHHKELGGLFLDEDDRRDVDDDDDTIEDFRPSLWSSLVLQYDYLRVARGSTYVISKERLARQLDEVNTTANFDRAMDLIEQAVQIGIFKEGANEGLELREEHPIVAKTHLIRDHIVTRVSNTLEVRSWEYVNYGFLLKGIAMDEKLVGKGINLDDNWRSEWIDFLVREGILERELIPHRHNPDDLVPVIRVPPHDLTAEIIANEDVVSEEQIEEMAYRIVVSVEQFTSFRKFVWCPLGSLHKRLRDFDVGTTFQRAVETLQQDGAVDIQEYPNPQSNFLTKGVSLVYESATVDRILEERNTVIRTFLKLYDNRQPITPEVLKQLLGYADRRIQLWISIMELENVLNAVPGQEELYSLFRTHHTVSLVAGD